jgi:MFS family permease
VAPVTVLGRYASVLRGRGTAVPLTASIVGRLSLGMTTLALLLLVRETTGSYAPAGLVSAAYALAFALFGPSRARAADRTGPVRALLLTAAVHPPALVLLVVLAVADVPTAVLLPVAVVAGASVPPHGPVMRALWASLLHGPLRATAYSLESVVVELCFVVGPLLTALLAATVHPGAAVVASGLLALAGALGMVATGTVRAVVPHEAPQRSRIGPLASPAVRALLLTVAGIGIGFGAIEVALPAFVEQEGGRPAAAGVLLAVWGVGSIVGGLVYGGLDLRAPHRRQLPVLVAALAVGGALPLLAPGAVAMGVALFAYGLTIAPFSACNSLLLGESAPPGTTTEAFAWNTSMLFGGAALGTAVAGLLVDRVGPGAGLAVTAVAGGLALVASVSGVARLRGSEPVRT